MIQNQTMMMTKIRAIQVIPKTPKKNVKRQSVRSVKPKPD